jgi:flagellar biosynthesis protein
MSATGDNENQISQAAALKYDPGSPSAPVLAAFGEGHMAQKIVDIAKESGVPVMADPSLSSMLSKISVGDEISPDMYEAVAKVLAFVAEVDKRYSDKIKR